MPTFHKRSSLEDVLAQDDSRQVIEQLAPEVLASPFTQLVASFPVGGILEIVLEGDKDRIARVVHALNQIEDGTSPASGEPEIELRSDYEESSVSRGSATLTVPTDSRKLTPTELVLRGPSHGNPFTDVRVDADFTHENHTMTVGGFYDGEGTYIVRFLPPQSGQWSVKLTSNARSLDGLEGQFYVAESDAKGPVRVVDDVHFAYADGTPFAPLGTTAYAWTHQPEPLQLETLASLATAPFNKLRMALFPKDFLHNHNEPERFVFERDSDGNWDTTRFDLEYFRHLESRVAELSELGIEADLILFHPYDRWGFAKLGRAADRRYVDYVVRRLAGYPNVWWSLANEWDLVLSKTVEDWNDIGQLVRDTDPVGHLLSIHNWIEVWDYDAPWTTHCSIQAGERLNSQVRAWRRRWNKPVLVDECGYEGDLDQGWGSLTAQDEVRRMWEIAMGGGYGTHGETYLNPDDVVFWSKGGQLRGESPARLEFLARILDDSPSKRLDPLPSSFDDSIAGVEGEYYIIYLGGGQPRFRTVTIPDRATAAVDVLDTWNMTVQSLPGTHLGTVTVNLPGRPYIAIRLRIVRID